MEINLQTILTIVLKIDFKHCYVIFTQIFIKIQQLNYKKYERDTQINSYSNKI